MPRFSDFQRAEIKFAQPVETREGEWAQNTTASKNVLGNLGKLLKISAAAPLVAVGTLALAGGVIAPAMVALAPILFVAGTLMEAKSRSENTMQAQSMRAQPAPA